MILLGFVWLDGEDDGDVAIELERGVVLGGHRPVQGQSLALVSAVTLVANFGVVGRNINHLKPVNENLTEGT